MMNQNPKDFIIAIFVAQMAYSVYKTGFSRCFYNLKMSVLSLFIKAVDILPTSPVSKEIQKIKAKLNEQLETGIKTELPELPMSLDSILNTLNQYKKLDSVDIFSGKISGCVYHANDKQREKIIIEAISMFIDSNPLHPDLFKAVRQMESDIIRMTIRLYNGTDK